MLKLEVVNSKSCKMYYRVIINKLQFDKIVHFYIFTFIMFRSDHLPASCNFIFSHLLCSDQTILEFYIPNREINQVYKKTQIPRNLTWEFPGHLPAKILIFIFSVLCKRTEILFKAYRLYRMYIDLLTV